MRASSSSFPRAVPPREELVRWLTQDFAPQVPECMRAAVHAAVAEGAFRQMPNQFMPARPDVRKQGVAFLGDALNMRHPFTGGLASFSLFRIRISA